MGYCRVVQCGDITEVYKYENNVNKRKISPGKRPRKTDTTVFYRTVASSKRAKKNFTMLVSAVLHSKNVPIFCTQTYIENVSVKIAYENNRTFFQNIKNYIGELSYITVPEWQNSGTIHLHSLIWGLPKEIANNERKSRFLQSCWARGFIDVRIARNNSPKIARYLAKYMSKAYEDTRLSNCRAFSHSNNLPKRYSYGSNTLNSFDDIFPEQNNLTSSIEYETMFLGKCLKLTYINHGNKSNC